jgi:hypothetical protein
MALPVDSEAPVGDLARFEVEWAKAPAPSEDPYNDIPDGTYDAVIEDAHLTETISTGRPMVVWKLRIQGPQAVNRIVTKNRVITENTLGMLKEDLEKCRVRVSRLSELPARLAELVDRPIGLDKRTKDGKTNFYFRWAAVRTSQNGVSGDDIPF